jgi:hypothetical protein
MSVPVCIMDPKAGQPQWMMEASEMKDHNGVLMMQRVLLAGTLGLAMARKAAAILEGEPSQPAPPLAVPDGTGSQGAPGFREPQGQEGAVLRAILDAANECLGHFDDRPAGERWSRICVMTGRNFGEEARSASKSKARKMGNPALISVLNC